MKYWNEKPKETAELFVVALVNRPALLVGDLPREVGVNPVIASWEETPSGCGNLKAYPHTLLIPQDGLSSSCFCHP